MKARILVVDDAIFMRRMISEILEENGMEVVGEADTGAVAVKLYNELKPDLVTMDIIMPNLGGLEALKGIISEDPGAKVVMCTALGQEDKVREAVIHGARGYIVKPFKAERVRQELEKVLSK